MAMARPLPPDARGAFLERVAARLAGQVLGDGLVARTCRELQREYLDPPDLSRASGSKACGTLRYGGGGGILPAGGGGGTVAMVGISFSMLRTAV